MNRGHKSISMSLLIITTFLFAVSGFKIDCYGLQEGEIIRLSGGDRFETAIEISKEGWKSSEWVILVTGEGSDKFADALAGAPLSASLNAPILLTSSKKVTNATAQEIERLGADKVYILGGTKVIWSTVKNELEKYGRSVIRLSGKNRYETAIDIGAELKKYNSFTKVILTTGSEFQYAMMAAPFAAVNSIPILFTEKDELHSSTKEALTSWSIKEVDVVGNSSIISDNIVDELKDMGINAVRIGGADLQETNINIVKAYCHEPASVAIARDDLFADALPGGPFAAKNNMPIFLVNEQYISEDMSAYIASLKPNAKYVFGGATAISEDTLDTLFPPSDILLAAENMDAGNTPGNITNGGLATLHGGWIYFSHSGDMRRLYKSKIDGTHLVKLSDSSCSNINVSGDWIYYVNEYDENRLYKMKRDGSENQLICNDTVQFVNLAGDWIFYSNYNDGRKIYRVKLDGSSRAKLSDDEAYFINVWGNWIYYSNYSEEKKIYKIKTNGMDRSEVCEDQSSYINVDGNWIYYCNNSDEGKLYKVTINGKNKKKLNNETSNYINVSDNVIYYVSGSKRSSIYSIRPDGSGREFISHDTSSFINTAGHWLYYINENDQCLYKVQKDGNKRQSIFSEEITPLVVRY